MSFRTEKQIARSNAKRLIRHRVFRELDRHSKVVSFAGANLLNLVDFYHRYGYNLNDIVLYETSIQVNKHNYYKNNLTGLKRQGLTYITRNILEHTCQPDTLYDIDFCETIRNKGAFVEKFNDNFVFTFSLRKGYTRQKTLKEFFGIRREGIFNNKDRGFLNSTKGNSYFTDTYKNTSTGGTSMIVIAKVPNIII